MTSVDNLLVSHSTLSPRQPRQTTYKKGLISNNMTWGYFLKSFHKINRSQNKDHNSNTQCLVLVQKLSIYLWFMVRSPRPKTVLGVEIHWVDIFLLIMCVRRCI